jgi:peptidyl-prolyl cis-trans isomerase C
MKLYKLTTYLGLFFTAGWLVAQPQPPVKPASAPLAKPAEGDAKPAAPAPTVPPETAVVTIGGEKLTRAQFEQILTALADNGRPATTPAAKRQVANQLGEIMALAQEARRRKVDLGPGVQEMIAIQTDQVLGSALARQVSNDLKIDDAALHAYYDQHKSQYENATASHILIKFKAANAPAKPGEKELTEEEALAKAQDLRKQLLAGADFAKLAKENSDDPGSKNAGGSLGSSAPGKYVPTVDQAIFSLPVGEISQPVKSPFGYHIIKVEARTAKSFDEVRADIEKKIRPQLTRETMEKLSKQPPVVLDEAYFGK